MIDWGLLNKEKTHAKVLDLTQIVINDLFSMITSCFEDGRPSDIVTDFCKTFYPAVVGEEEPEHLDMSVQVTQGLEGEPRTSFGTFGGERPAELLNQSLTTLEDQNIKVSRYR